MEDLRNQRGSSEVIDPFLFEARGELDRWAVDTSEFLERERMRLEGVYIGEDGRLVRDNTRKVMNHKGSVAYIDFIASYITHHIIFGNLREKDIVEMASDCAIDILDLLITNYKEYDLKKQHIPALVHRAYYIVYSILTRAKEGREATLRAPNRRIIKQEIVSREIKKGEEGI